MPDLQKTCKKHRLLVVIFTVMLWLPGLASAFQRDANDALAKAQQWLAAGQYQKAYPVYLFQAQEKQNHLAQFTVAMFHEHGWGMNRDMQVACYWYEKAAKGKIPAASHFFAQCLENGVHQPVNYAAAIRWYQEAADLGHFVSRCAIAKLVMQGKGAAKDPEKALDYCRQAANDGSIPAQLQMGKFYLQGDSAIQDPHQAATWFGYAAAQGNLEAQYYLGVIHLNFFNNHPVALNWFEAAASQGYQSAYFPTAQLYFNAPFSDDTDMPTADNLAKSYMWLSATARQVNDQAQLRDAKQMLNQVEHIMPVSWKEDLDEKITQHLLKFHQE